MARSASTALMENATNTYIIVIHFTMYEGFVCATTNPNACDVGVCVYVQIIRVAEFRVAIPHVAFVE